MADRATPETGAAAGDGERQQVAAVALRLLARREHSPLELRNKLLGRQFDAALVDEVLAELSGGNLLSEQRFTETFVRQRYERGYGPVRIRAELRERGIEAGCAEAALAGWSGAWLESAERQREKRFGAACPEDYRERTRQMRFLQQRGFTGEQIRALFRE